MARVFEDYEIMPQMCPKCSHNNRGKQSGIPCSQCGVELQGLLGFGEIVRDYSPQKVLGCGGFSAVYLAKDLKKDRDVAVKEMFNLTEDDVNRFEHEATILSHLRHPQLPRFYDHFEHKDKRYLVMEYIGGQSLHDIILQKQRQGEKVRETVAYGWALQLCDAVAYLHAEGIIHRDIKPDNVRLTPTGEICLVDLGIAKQLALGMPTVTVVHGLTPGYAPIEQYASRTSRYKGRTDERSDIYAIGTTMYTVVTNLIPPDARALVAGTEVLPPVQAVHPQVSNQFALTIEQAMELQPEERFASVADMRKSFMGELDLGDEDKAEEDEQKTASDKGDNGGQPASPPFQFYAFDVAHNLAELVQKCDERWEEAKEHLYEQHFEKWKWFSGNCQWGLLKLATEIREGQPNRDVGLDVWLEEAARIAHVKRQRPQVVVSSDPPPPVDLGEVRDWDSEKRLVQLRLKLEGSRTRRSLVGCAPCLDVNTTQIEWPPDGVTTLDVVLKPGVALDIGEHLLSEAIWLETDHQKQTIAARIVVRAPIEIRIEPDFLDFGQVDPRRPVTRSLIVRNPGKEGWQGKLETASWLEVNPQQMECNAGDEVNVQVCIRQEALERPGNYQDSPAISVRVADQSCEVSARATVRPIVTVSPEKLDFENVDSGHCPERQLKLHYTGEIDWEGEVTANVPWLEIREVKELPPDKGMIGITVAPQPDELQGPGVYKEKRAITISEKGGEEIIASIAARLVAVQPSLVLSATLVDFGQVTDPQTVKPQRVKVHNPSLFEWQGVSRSAVPWLEVKPTRPSCAGGKDAYLEIGLTQALGQMNPGSVVQTKAVQLQGMGQDYSLGVELILVARPEPEPSRTTLLEVQPPTVDFGQVPSWTTARPQRIELRNTSPKNLRLSIESKLSWLTIQPRVVDCPAGGHAVVEASLSQMARHLRPGEYRRPGAISILGAGEPRVLEANLEIKPGVAKVPEVKATEAKEIEVKPSEAKGIEVKPLVVDFGPVSRPEGHAQEIEIINHTPSGWSGVITSRYPWLEYAPAVVDCPSGQQVTLCVQLSQRYFKNLPVKQYDRAEAIVINSQTDEEVFAIRVRLQKLKS